MPVKTLNAFMPGEPWPPKSEQARLDRYTQNRVLWKAKADRIPLLKKDYVKALDEPTRFILNIHKRLSTLWADMLFGEPPLWSSGDEESAENKWVRAMADRVAFNTVGYEVGLDTSIYGDGVFRVGLEAGQATIDAQPPRHWFPVVAPNNIRRIQAHVLADVVTSGTHNYLVLEIHTRGKIQHKVHRLLNVTTEGQGGKIGEQVSLTSILPEIANREGVGDAGLETTGVDDFLIIPVHNLRTSEEVHGRDDYSDLDTIINGLEERLDQINDILRKHAEPFMTGPRFGMEQDSVTGLWRFNTQDKYLPRMDKEDPPYEYLVWDGRLEDALNNFNLLMEQLYFVSETTPAAFGQLKQGLAESGSALARLMLPVLQKTGRLQGYFDPAMKKALLLASQLENASITDVGSQWRDGLPEDMLEVAQAVQYNTTAGAMSRRTAIRTLHPDWTQKQIQEELDELDEDAAMATPMPPANVNPTNGGGPDADAA